VKTIGKKKIESKKTVIHGFEFDSKSEADYYDYLIRNKEALNIREIEVHVKFELFPEIFLQCFICQGSKKVKSEKTGNLIKCRKCSGTGKRKSNGAIYTADFVITYNNSQREVIDVKGFANDSFSLRKRLFEQTYRLPLLIVKRQGRGWVKND
jgi:hypothetical protein